MQSGPDREPNDESPSHDRYNQFPPRFAGCDDFRHVRFRSQRALWVRKEFEAISIHQALESAARFILLRPDIAMGLAQSTFGKFQQPSDIPRMVMGPGQGVRGQPCVMAQFGNFGPDRNSEQLFKTINAILFSSSLHNCEASVHPEWAFQRLDSFDEPFFDRLTGIGVELESINKPVMSAHFQVPCSSLGEDNSELRMAVVQFSSPREAWYLQMVFEEFMGSGLTVHDLDWRLLEYLSPRPTDAEVWRQPQHTDEVMVSHNHQSDQLPYYGTFYDSHTDPRASVSALLAHVDNHSSAQYGLVDGESGIFEYRLLSRERGDRQSRRPFSLMGSTVDSYRSGWLRRRRLPHAEELSFSGKMRTHCNSLMEVFEALPKSWGAYTATFSNTLLEPQTFWKLKQNPSDALQVVALNSGSLLIADREGRRLQVKIDTASGEAILYFQVKSPPNKIVPLAQEALALTEMIQELSEAMSRCNTH